MKIYRGEVWYRIEDRLYSDGWDPDYDRSLGSHTRITVREFPVLKHTSKGVWLKVHNHKGKRFVLKDARKRFACPTIEEAKRSFEARKRRQLSIYRARIKTAEDALRLLDEGCFDSRLPISALLGR